MKIILLMLVLSSCASSNKAKLLTNGMPELKLKKHQMFLNNRKIASISDHQDFGSQSNKNIYFFSLLTQFNKLKSLGNIASLNLNSCPAFHHEMLKYKTNHHTPHYVNKNTKLESIGYSQKALQYYPELNLPTGPGNEILAASSDEDFQNDFKKALYHHSEKTFNELKELCDTGASSNYYVYLNFIRHISSKPKYYFEDHSFGALVKIPVIGNFIVLESLNESMNYNGAASFESEALRRVRGLWIYQYVNNLKETRTKISFKGSPNQTEPFQNALSSYPRVFDR